MGDHIVGTGEGLIDDPVEHSAQAGLHGQLVFEIMAAGIFKPDFMLCPLIVDVVQGRLPGCFIKLDESAVSPCQIPYLRLRDCGRQVIRSIGELPVISVQCHAHQYFIGRNIVGKGKRQDSPYVFNGGRRLRRPADISPFIGHNRSPVHQRPQGTVIKESRPGGIRHILPLGGQVQDEDFSVVMEFLCQLPDKLRKKVPVFRIQVFEVDDNAP